MKHSELREIFDGVKIIQMSSITKVDEKLGVKVGGMLDDEKPGGMFEKLFVRYLSDEKLLEQCAHGKKIVID
ncbi:MAG: hypothetical protein O7C59_06905 [Rickettsia endosymbiont of Ixodes persulcatus]|nr:hypothetical protein [Rickettsia endosymbiont of Ixodes persulcatus]